ncbi:restriction endonuclease subunit S, partial [Thiolapillus sp.]|uniref:restriction endonuclease subunit S n=1 Tax=Thiolapillus sp. TaxID=2017437 RepID=UPI003AF87E27
MSGKSDKKKPLVPRLRFPEFREAGAWEVKELSAALAYAQPTPFIVSTEQYGTSGTPVLTAGKTFILGHTSEDFGIYERVPVIIFDDFTTEAKFVDFPFKVKSSAIKILSPRPGYSLKFVLEAIISIQFDASQHKRHWIGEFQHLKIPFPPPKEQQKIAHCLSSLDEVIGLQAKKVQALKQHKKGLMQQLFPAEGETTPRLRFPEFREAGAWEVKRLGEVCIICNGSSNAQDHVDDGAYPLFDRSEEIKRSSRYLFDAEAVIIPGEGMRFIPKYYCGKFDLHQRAYALSDFREVGKFIYYQLGALKGVLASKAVMSTVLSLRMPILETFKLVIPSSGEQQKIAHCLSSLDEVIGLESHKLDALKNLKKGLMQQLFPQ